MDRQLESSTRERQKINLIARNETKRTDDTSCSLHLASYEPSSRIRRQFLGLKNDFSASDSRLAPKGSQTSVTLMPSKLYDISRKSQQEQQRQTLRLLEPPQTSTDATSSSPGGQYRQSAAQCSKRAGKTLDGTRLLARFTSLEANPKNATRKVYSNAIKVPLKKVFPLETSEGRKPRLRGRSKVISQYSKCLQLNSHSSSSTLATWLLSTIPIPVPISIPSASCCCSLYEDSFCSHDSRYKSQDLLSLLSLFTRLLDRSSVERESKSEESHLSHLAFLLLVLPFLYSAQWKPFEAESCCDSSRNSRSIKNIIHSRRGKKNHAQPEELSKVTRSFVYATLHLHR